MHYQTKTGINAKNVLPTISRPKKLIYINNKSPNSKTTPS